MILYEYICEKCEHIITKYRTVLMRNKPLICEKCGSFMKRRLFYKDTAIHFIGDGFYSNDYKKEK